MIPVELSDDVRKLDLMLHGGVPLRADADFGKEEMGHMDGVKSRVPQVLPSPQSKPTKAEVVIERYLISEDGAMSVEGPDSGLKEQ